LGLEPVMLELRLSRKQLVSQAEQIGTLRADLATAQARIATLEPPHIDASPGSVHEAIRPMVALLGPLVAGRHHDGGRGHDRAGRRPPGRAMTAWRRWLRGTQRLVLAVAGDGLLLAWPG
jgi:hypothetical protein